MFTRKARILMAAAAAAFVLAGAPAAKAQMLDSYTAYLGADDHYNSNGQRLTQPWQIIRQDRANFHRFGIRDRGDQGDSFFASAANRARMERMIQNGHIERSAANAIVNGQVWIHVEIYPNFVNVSVQ